MRYFLLPLSTRRTLLYCERNNPSRAAAATQPSGVKPPLIDRLTARANRTWVEWENVEEGTGFVRGGWKKMVTDYGNKAFRRISFEEWGLKSIPPLSTQQRQILERGESRAILALYPGAFLKEEKVLPMLKKMATERQALHTKRLWLSVLAMPVTIPFGLIPILPNIPFFYLAFRAWSHYRALYGSKHLELVLAKNLVVPKPDTRLDAMYSASLTHSTQADAETAAMPTTQEVSRIAGLVEQREKESGKETILLKKWSSRVIAKRFKLPAMEIEIERAVEQVENQLAAQESVMAEEQRRGVDQKSAIQPEKVKL
ncbi:hypothetical protein LTR66_010817 [Elasticomyces elasticus]|nr:hypothetical protein LTR66_010817 [Elasticomyces elasticus]